MSTLADKPAIPPRPPERVYDPSGFMSTPARKVLILRLLEYTDDTKHELGVWIGPAPEGSSIAAWCTVAFNAWGVGRKGVDDGVVLFIFPESEYAQITVGYGLERALSDQEASKIIKRVLSPRFRVGLKDEAVIASVDAIIAEIAKGRE